MSNEEAPAVVVAKPRPVPDDQSEGFWRAAAEHVLALQRCNSCGRFAHPPVLVCPACLSVEAEFTFVPVEGPDGWRPGPSCETPFCPDSKRTFLGSSPRPNWTNRRACGCWPGSRAGLTSRCGVGPAVETVFEDVAPGLALPVLRLVR